MSGWLHISAHDVYNAQREEKLSLVLVINMEYFGLHEIQYQPFEDTKVVGEYNFYLSKDTDSMIKFVNDALELVCADDNDVQVKNTRRDNGEE